MDWSAIAASLTAQGLEVIQDPQQRKKLSTDYAHFSPILTVQLQGKQADLVVLARSETEAIAVIRCCVANKIPLTVRGAGTGNYGQCVPLQGGIVLDLSPMQRIMSLEPGKAVVEPGVKLGRLEQQARQIGWELRLLPSTYQTATVGGFVSGGSTGIGAVNYGTLFDPGNVQSLTVLTMEAEPQRLVLPGQGAQPVIHGYGTNGIITEVTLPLTPALPWREAIVSFTDLSSAIAFAQELANQDGIVSREISIQGHPIPQYFSGLKNYYQPGAHWVMVIISELDWFAFRELARTSKGEIIFEQNPQTSGKKINLIEFNWNHTTLLARTVDLNLTYLQVFFYQDLEQILTLEKLFEDEIMFHIEMMRIQGVMCLAGFPLVKFTNGDRLEEIMAAHQTLGARIANPHTYSLAGGSVQPLPESQLIFKRQVDPLDLLNPGKLTE
ncbi:MULTISPECIES: FAD-binding oxidoreductase [unclassified Synechocystis]|uniref:FAD-binding oxidoreductase n=1 Tax=unclassified Synechocystis TaxID=2640012 RepID=UPI0003F573C1|nr:MULTISPECIES: FAD-binding oxidoreductase [unclassified Synechocystis]AIE73670.1 FAD/FMN-containing dehydrogenase [Synechocystis sp. PCC 6714]MCT0255027.1 FAD-binding oxidoreductase [Synechocystis sp. CS-94]